MDNMLNIGNSKETIAEAKDCILQILKSGVEQETIRAALEILPQITKVDNTVIQYCNFTCENKKNSDGEKGE